jgi:gp16 family phage-associated protein
MLPDMEATEVIVRGWLAASGLTAATVARRAGVSASTLHRVLNGRVDPSVGTLREIALACGIEMELTARPLSDPHASAAARAMLESGYKPPQDREVAAWQERLVRMAESDSPVDVVKAAATASSPLLRPGAILLFGELPLARIASAGDAANGRWAISGAAGLYLPLPSAAAPAVTILWCEDVRRVIQLLAETDLRQTHRLDRAVLAVIAGEPELFSGSFTEGIVRYAAPIQIILDCLSQAGTVADDALREAMSW